MRAALSVVLFCLLPFYFCLLPFAFPCSMSYFDEPFHAGSSCSGGLCSPLRAVENKKEKNGRESFGRNPAKVSGAHGRPCLGARARRLSHRNGEDEARGPAHRARGD